MARQRCFRDILSVEEIEVADLRAAAQERGRQRRKELRERGLYRRPIVFVQQFDFFRSPEADEHRLPIHLGKARKALPDPRPVSLRCKKITKRELADGKRLRVWYGQRPKTRGECAGVPRPCPFTTCQYHLYVDPNPDKPWLKFNFPHLDVLQMKESCALDVADRGGLEPKQIAPFLNITTAGVSKILRGALRKMAEGLGPDAVEALARAGRVDRP